jgi:hypothetical protein
MFGMQPWITDTGSLKLLQSPFIILQILMDLLQLNTSIQLVRDSKLGWCEFAKCIVNQTDMQFEVDD